jgi:hypothetical protein
MDMKRTNGASRLGPAFRSPYRTSTLALEASRLSCQLGVDLRKLKIILGRLQDPSRVFHDYELAHLRSLGSSLGVLGTELALVTTGQREAFINAQTHHTPDRFWDEATLSITTSSPK